MMKPAIQSESAALLGRRRSRWSLAGEQLAFLGHELRLLTDGRPARWLVLFFEPSAGVIMSYRLDRSCYLLSLSSGLGEYCQL